MPSQKCTLCNHPRNQHSTAGCTHGDKDYGKCTCPVKYMDTDMFK